MKMEDQTRRKEIQQQYIADLYAEERQWNQDFNAQKLVDLRSQPKQIGVTEPCFNGINQLQFQYITNRLPFERSEVEKLKIDDEINILYPITVFASVLTFGIVECSEYNTYDTYESISQEITQNQLFKDMYQMLIQLQNPSAETWLAVSAVLFAAWTLTYLSYKVQLARKMISTSKMTCLEVFESLIVSIATLWFVHGFYLVYYKLENGFEQSLDDSSNIAKSVMYLTLAFGAIPVTFFSILIFACLSAMIGSIWWQYFL